MPKEVFQFRQFEIHQDKTAMKVGTDGVLVGTWSGSVVNEMFGQSEPGKILDVGTGTGIVALMLAQQFPDAHVHAIEVDEDAFLQAKENFKGSQFHSRLSIEKIPFQKFSKNAPGKFNLIATNPPYFMQSYLPPDKARNIARHSDALPFAEMIKGAVELLSDEGLFSLILPANVAQSFAIEAASKGLHLIRLVGVRDTEEHPIKRSLMAFSKQMLPMQRKVMELYEKGREERSAAFQKLTENFYLQP